MCRAGPVAAFRASSSWISQREVAVSACHPWAKARPYGSCMATRVPGRSGLRWWPLWQAAGLCCVLSARPSCGLNLTRTVIVASSLGAPLAYQFAEAWPPRVTQLILLGCPAFVDGFQLPPFNGLASALGMGLRAVRFTRAWLARVTSPPQGHAAPREAGRAAPAGPPAMAGQSSRPRAAAPVVPGVMRRRASGDITRLEA